MRLPCVATLVISLLLCGCSCGKRPGAIEVAVRNPWKYRDYNLVFVSFDALQAAHVGCMGYARNVTPTIDAIAREAFQFTRTASVASWTVPASMTWFTGVFPSEHRMVNKFAIFNARERKLATLKERAPDLVTLAQLMKSNGYATGGFTGNAGVSGGFGYEQGFDVYFHEKDTFGRFDRSVPEALEWLNTHKNQKFFLFLHGYDVHGQSTPAGGYDHRFVDKEYDGKFLGSPLEQEALREEGLERGRLALRDEDVRFWRAIYDEKIQRADALFRQFLDQFEALGISDKTLFVITSDHGTEFCEHGRLDHGFTLYQELIHVPLIFKIPDRITGNIIADRVSSIDVMPTILDLLDLDIENVDRDRLRGKSLVPAMKGEPVARDAFSETDYREYTYKRSVITPDGWKLIVTLENKTRELYDLNTDPKETHDLAAEQPERAAELERKVFAHFQAIGHDLTARRWETGLNPVYPSQAPKK